MLSHLVLIASDEKTIIDNVRLHPSLRRVSPDYCSTQELKEILVNPLPIGCTLLVRSPLFRVCFRIPTSCVL